MSRLVKHTLFYLLVSSIFIGTFVSNKASISCMFWSIFLTLNMTPMFQVITVAVAFYVFCFMGCQYTVSHAACIQEIYLGFLNQPQRCNENGSIFRKWRLPVISVSFMKNYFKNNAAIAPFFIECKTLYSFLRPDTIRNKLYWELVLFYINKM